MSIQNPPRTIRYSCLSAAIFGKISRSIDVGLFYALGTGKRGNGDAADHRGVEQIDARVDVVPHVFFGLLNEAIDAALG